MGPRKRQVKTTRRAEKHRAAKPLLPVTIITSFKGGVGKTAIAVASSERAAHAGLKVLLVCTDPQMDAVKRLGYEPRFATPISVLEETGEGGLLDVLCVNKEGLLDVLYRTPEFTAMYDVAIVDTAPEAKLGSLDHVRYWIPVDGRDAGQNTVVLLKHRQPTSTVVLVPVKHADVEDVGALADMLGVSFWGETISDSVLVAEAHNDGMSVWSLSPRRGNLVEHLDLAAEIALELWEDVHGNEPFPDHPDVSEVMEYVPVGWE